MKAIFEDDFWNVSIRWSKPVAYATAKKTGSSHDDGANLYMITVRYSDKPYKPVYIGKTYAQDVQKRLNQVDHLARYAAISKHYPKHKIHVRYGKVTMQGSNVTKKRIRDIENILIYCYDNEHARNIKSIYSHGVKDSYQIINSGSKCMLPKCLAFGFFSRG